MPADRSTLLLLVSVEGREGALLVAQVAGTVMAIVHTLPGISLRATSEAAALHAWPHPTQAGAALVAVEAELGGVTVVELPHAKGTW
jgi:hypothetical protein